MVERQFTEGRLAALYDAFFPPARRDDFAFYLPLVQCTRAVLDVGCGTGALLHLARKDGHPGRLCGLDPAPGMLAQARERTDIEWVLGDLSSVVWDREFDLIVMTGHAFQELIGDDEIGAALAAIRRALVDDFLDPNALSSFLADAGLAIEEQFGDWTRAPLTGASPEIITIARRV
jgi:ubiquinone/menaquinone biosynthesis C-methylase UbiE